jgi:predicted ATPase
LALLDAAPERAKSAAQPYAALLAQLSNAVRERLGVVAVLAPESAGELRVRVQEAVRDWLLALARERPLVVLVDDLEHADSGSAAFLLALALGAADAKLLLVCTLLRDRARTRSAALRAFRKAAHGIVLPLLTAAELHTLLQSVFSTADRLSRLASRLFELTRGNPGYALELCRELVERGAITFDSGTWMLPRELDGCGLSSTREQALTERLARIPTPARELARLLSVHSGPLTPGPVSYTHLTLPTM